MLAQNCPFGHDRIKLSITTLVVQTKNYNESSKSGIQQRSFHYVS